jgi:hypothetical protein
MAGYSQTSPPGQTGLIVEPPTPCRQCNGVLATIGAGTQPHAASLRCTTCGGHRGHLSLSTWSFISSIAGKYGAPTEPIKIRRSSYEQTP